MAAKPIKSLELHDTLIQFLLILCFHTGPSEPSKQEQTFCAAVAATTKIPSKGKARMEFALCWDNPVVHFGSSKNKHYR